MTLLELVVVMSVITALIAMMFPVIGMITNSASASTSRQLVRTLVVAMRAYADEDPRHFFPTPAANNHLVYDPTNANAVLTLLASHGYVVPMERIDPTSHELLDGWERPILYQLDGPYFSSPGVISHAGMNGAADRPAADSAWNPKGVEPFAYVWSLGKPTKAGDAADALAANSANWLYEKGVP
jgi:type II secretory pathway pseudopilin PulG